MTKSTSATGWKTPRLREEPAPGSKAPDRPVELTAGPHRSRRAWAGVSWALRRFRELPTQERGLLLSAVLTLALVRLALYATPTRWLLRRVLGRAERPTRGGEAANHVLVARQVGLAVRRASRVVPHATCLPQALAVIWMLAGRGHTGALRIGVKRGTAGELVAHAWVEHENRIIIGGPGVKQYAVLPSLEGALWLR